MQCLQRPWNRTILNCPILDSESPLQCASGWKALEALSLLRFVLFFYAFVFLIETSALFRIEAAKSLIFSALLFGISLLYSFRRNSLAFLCVFPFFSKDFRGLARIKNPFFWWFSLSFSQKSKEKKIREQATNSDPPIPPPPLKLTISIFCAFSNGGADLLSLVSLGCLFPIFPWKTESDKKRNMSPIVRGGGWGTEMGDDISIPLGPLGLHN